MSELIQTTNLPDPLPPPSRRALLKTAGTAAWDAPVTARAAATAAAPAAGSGIPGGDPNISVTVVLSHANGITS